MKKIDVRSMQLNAVDVWMRQGLLLTAGTMDDYNMMTVGWGSIGCMWSRPFAQVVVRPQRHTRKYIESSGSFTLCAFPDEYRDDLQKLGSISGRTGDKLSKTKLTLTRSREVEAPSYNEASLILECRKIYFQDMDPRGFLDEAIAEHYAAKDYHCVYFGEIIAAFGA